MLDESVSEGAESGCGRRWVGGEDIRKRKGDGGGARSSLLEEGDCEVAEAELLGGGRGGLGAGKDGDGEEVLDGGAEDGDGVGTAEEGAQRGRVPVVAGYGEDAIKEAEGVGHLEDVQHRRLVDNDGTLARLGLVSLWRRACIVVLGLDPLALLGDDELLRRLCGRRCRRRRRACRSGHV